MGNTLLIPDPQHRYLEPFKNRVFQYDTKHSNMVLSHYVNQVLTAVGNDVIVRGLEITPYINAYKTGIRFAMNPGALIQDLTYFELPVVNTIEVADVVNFPEWYVVIYSNWRYLHTIYDNDLKIEATFYNPKTRKAISGWDSSRNRIIFGVFSYEIDENGYVTFIKEEPGSLFFEDSNIIQNGTFDYRTHKYWTAINSTIKIEEEGGLNDTPYLNVTPIADNYQGIAQVLSTKLNYTYEVSFQLRSDFPIPFSVLVLDGNSLYNMSAPEIEELNILAPSEWTEFSFRFTAASNRATIFFLKRSESFRHTFDIDHIYCIEYAENRKNTDINRIKTIDGGILGEQSFIPDEPINPDEEEIVPVKVVVDSQVGVKEYHVNIVNPTYKNTIVFYGPDLLDINDYSFDGSTLILSFSPKLAGVPITAVYVHGDVQYTNTISGDKTYDINPPEEEYPISLYFYGTNLTSESDYTLTDTLLTTRFVPSGTEDYMNITRLYGNKWKTSSVSGVTKYECPITETENTLVFYGGDLLYEDDYTLADGKLTLTKVKTTGYEIVVIDITSTYEPVGKDKPIVITLGSQVGAKDYYINIKEPSYKNTLVFYGSVLLDINDFVFNNNMLSLNFEPTANDLPISVVHIDGEVQYDYTMSGDKTYSFAAPSDDYNLELCFYSGNISSDSDYSTTDTTLTLGFTPDNDEDYISLARLNGNKWKTVTTAGIRKYTCTITEGSIIAFYGGSLMSQNDYTLASGMITLTFDPEDGFELIVINVGKSNIPPTSGGEIVESPTDSYFTVNTQNGVRNYSITANAKNENIIFFYGPKLMTTEDYGYTSGSLNLTFNPDNDSDEICSVSFDGYMKRGKATAKNKSYTIDTSTAGGGELVFCGPILLSENDYTIGENKITFNIDIAEEFEYTVIIPEWNTPRIPVKAGLTTYSSGITSGMSRVFYGGSLLSPSDYNIDNNGNVKLNFTPTKSDIELTVWELK